MWFALGGCWLDGRVYRRHPDHVRLDRRELIKRGRRIHRGVSIHTYFAPREYNSIATIEVQADMTPVHLVENQTEARAPEDTKFSQTQIEIILRKGVIYPVIDLLNLLDQWSQNGKRLSHEAAFNKLRGMLKLDGVRNYEPDSDHRQCP